MELEKELFKAVLGELISTKYEELSPEEVVKIAMGAVGSFSKQNGVRLDWLIKN